jgi:hypothetical protein
MAAKSRSGLYKSPRESEIIGYASVCSLSASAGFLFFPRIIVSCRGTLRIKVNIKLREGNDNAVVLQKEATMRISGRFRPSAWRPSSLSIQ